MHEAIEERRRKEDLMKMNPDEKEIWDPMVRAMVRDFPNTPRVEVWPDFLKSPEQKTQGTISLLGVQDAGSLKNARKAEQQRRVGAPPLQCYGASRCPPPPRLRQNPWWELGFELPPRHQPTSSTGKNSM
jgi:hypothetical protein